MVPFLNVSPLFYHNLATFHSFFLTLRINVRKTLQRGEAVEHIEHAIQCELKLRATAALNKEIAAEQEQGDPTPEDAEKVIEEHLLCTSHQV